MLTIRKEVISEVQTLTDTSLTLKADLVSGRNP